MVNNIKGNMWEIGFRWLASIFLSICTAVLIDLRMQWGDFEKSIDTLEKEQDRVALVQKYQEVALDGTQVVLKNHDIRIHAIEIRLGR